MDPKENENGRYPSPLEDFPGYVRFAEPFVGRHYRLYYSTFNRAEKDQYDNSPRMRLWRGALAVEGDTKIISEWSLTGPSGPIERPDSKNMGDDVPLEVITFVAQSVDDYIAGKLNLGQSPEE